ncbi:endonuclease domain-containing protein [Microbacterium trichothecenolyticum]|uniref:endonuclease domain-containing protein n=1 Tax=Microbacterium trichothecenolyticum TaxID=69370 RepID=UPI0027D79235|nr:DUF559 domain-containing protein [Microbacterium trichothecenolyticum]
MCTPADGIHRRLDLLEAGFRRHDIDRAVGNGSFVRLRRGVYADAETCEPRRSAALHGGALACVSAARHVGLWVLSPTDPLHIALRPHGHGHPHDGCVCVEHWDHEERNRFRLATIRGILRQIFFCRGVEEFFVALESALHARKIGRSGLDWLAKNTSPLAREAIALARRDAESGLESLVRWRLRHLDLTVRTQVRIDTVGRVDLLIGDALIVEVDGVENHRSAEHRHRDLLRDARAAAQGFVTLRFDYALVVHDWETVERAIGAHVERGIHRR